MHPDQRTPDNHRYTAPDSKAGKRHPHRNESKNPEPEGKRIAEAGNAYVGRQMDDDLKAHPRVEEPGAGTASE